MLNLLILFCVHKNLQRMSSANVQFRWFRQHYFWQKKLIAWMYGRWCYVLVELSMCWCFAICHTQSTENVLSELYSFRRCIFVHSLRCRVRKWMIFWTCRGIACNQSDVFTEVISEKCSCLSDEQRKRHFLQIISQWCSFNYQVPVLVPRRNRPVLPSINFHLTRIYLNKVKNSGSGQVCAHKITWPDLNCQVESFFDRIWPRSSDF